MTKDQIKQKIKKLEDRLKTGKSLTPKTTQLHIDHLKWRLNHPIRFWLHNTQWNIRKKIAQFIYPFSEE